MEDKIKELGLLLGKANKLFEEIQNTPTNDPSPNPQFEVGEWYSITQDGEHCNGLISFDTGKQYVLKFKEYRATNFGKRVIFTKPSGEEVMFVYEKMKWLNGPATPEEVKQALVKEAERRGLIDGVTVKSIVHSCDKIITLKGKSYVYDLKSDMLHLNSYGCIYEKGIWVEIIKEEVIKIGGYHVNFRNGTTTIDTYEFPKEFWQAAKVVAEHTKAAVWVGCDAKKGGPNQWMVELSTINSILNKLK